MALPATDNFNRADGAVGANWTAISASGHLVASNQCKGAADTYCYSRWSADAFNADHYAQFTAVNTNAYSGPIVRAGAGPDCYVWFINFGTTGTLYRIDDGGFTELQSGIPAPAAGSVVKVTAEGTAIKLWDDGVQVGTTQTDATYAGGSAGMFSYGTTPPVPLLDDWEGGNMVAAPAGHPAMKRWGGVPFMRIGGPTFGNGWNY